MPRKKHSIFEQTNNKNYPELMNFYDSINSKLFKGIIDLARFYDYNFLANVLEFGKGIRNIQDYSKHIDFMTRKVPMTDKQYFDFLQNTHLSDKAKTLEDARKIRDNYIKSFNTLFRKSYNNR